MIKYTKEEFPARFTVVEHKCEYCGVKFFSNRAKTKYDTGTCRTYANKRKRENALPPVPDYTDLRKFRKCYYCEKMYSEQELRKVVLEGGKIAEWCDGCREGNERNHLDHLSLK